MHIISELPSRVFFCRFFFSKLVVKYVRKINALLLTFMVTGHLPIVTKCLYLLLLFIIIIIILGQHKMLVFAYKDLVNMV